VAALIQSQRRTGEIQEMGGYASTEMVCRYAHLAAAT
jgi:hypothetical protein